MAASIKTRQMMVLDASSATLELWVVWVAFFPWDRFPHDMKLSAAEAFPLTVTQVESTWDDDDITANNQTRCGDKGFNASRTTRWRSAEEAERREAAALHPLTPPHSGDRIILPVVPNLLQNICTAMSCDTLLCSCKRR